jgi:hypothetical protein
MSRLAKRRLQGKEGIKVLALVPKSRFVRYQIGPQVHGPMTSVAGIKMLIRDDLRRCVVFIGTRDSEANGGINCVGTGFLLAYDDCRYLITAQHVAAGLGDDPYVIRLNKADGTADNIDVDPILHNVRWFSDPDSPDVDLAVMPFEYDLKGAGYDCLFIRAEHFVGVKAEVPIAKVGLGDLCYTIGLFQLVAGRKRNLPVVHRGSIALLAGEESVPVDDWLDPQRGKTRNVDCHLVETQSLKGLSGAPVFARGSFDIEGLPLTGTDEKHSVRLPLRDMSLLGIWQASWDTPPGTVLGVRDHQGSRVPVGMGVVIPVEKLVELLETEPIKEQRAELRRSGEAAKAASLDSKQ